MLTCDRSHVTAEIGSVSRVSWLLGRPFEPHARPATILGNELVQGDRMSELVTKKDLELVLKIQTTRLTKNLTVIWGIALLFFVMAVLIIE